METNPKQEPEKDIGAVWVKKAASGAQFLSITIDLDQFGVKQKVNLVGFKNKNKKEAKHPDFRVFISNREAAASRTAPAPPPPVAKPEVAAADLDI